LLLSDNDFHSSSNRSRADLQFKGAKQISLKQLFAGNFKDISINP